MWTYRHDHESVCVETIIIPDENAAAIEVPTAPYDRCAAALHLLDFHRLFLKHPPPSLPILPTQPLLIPPTNINPTPKNPRPLQVRRIKMRMGNRNRLQPSLRINKLHDLGVEIGDAVPEDVSLRGLQQDTALAYAEGFG